MDDDGCGAVDEMIGKEKPEYSGRSCSSALCPPQTSQNLTRARTRAASVGNRLLIAWTMARHHSLNKSIIQAANYLINEPASLTAIQHCMLLLNVQRVAALDRPIEWVIQPTPPSK
jgi:hypothetical protein